VIRYLKEHPWRSGGLAALVVIAAGLVVIVQLRRDARQAPPPTTAEIDDHAAHRDHDAPVGTRPAPDDPSLPAGFAPVVLEPGQAQAMGLTTAIVEPRDFSRTIRTVGIVTVDETRTAHVHARVRGWIERIHVPYVGRQVKRGEPLVSIYSQEVYAAQLELIALARSPVPSPELLDAARKRFTLWEVPRRMVERVERTGQPQRTFPVLSPRAGVVVARQAFDGLFVDPSIELYTIADLSRVWVVADLYDADVPHVEAGSEARLTVEGIPEPVTARVTFLSPTIDERTRTRKVRFEIANPARTLMPGAFATVELEVRADRGLGVPESAVIRTGRRAIVFVVHGAHVEPREIELGARIGDYYRVRAGLIAGERVATGAQFLLDSESRLRATSGPGAGHVGH
jgi:membrane fusion protein, copper/silver efflux system